MGKVKLSAEQLASLAWWSCAGPDMACVELFDNQPGFIGDWRAGDVVAVQGDAHVHVSLRGCVKDAVPPVDLA